MIDININNSTIEAFTVILSSKLHNHYGEILNISNMKFVNNLNEPKELSFEVDRYANGVEECLWSEIINFKYIYVKELNMYFEINVSISEGTNKKKVTARSACECELSQLILYNIEINTEIDIARLDYEPAVFYNPDNLNASFLNRILEKAPSYTINHVDDSLKSIQRSFSVSDKSIYEFLVDECATEFNCIFQFDSVNRSISVYDLYTVCNDCGYRGDYTDECPKCGSHNLKYFGEDTTILVTAENLTDNIQFDTNTDEVKNCFTLEAGDDATTAAAMTYIPSGEKQIYYVPDEQMRDMPKQLADRIKSYNEMYISMIGDYHALMERIYECIEGITYYTSKQMPDITITNTTASEEAAKLTKANLSPLSLSNLTPYTTLDTVNSALINYAKVYVRNGFVKIEIDSGSYLYSGTTNEIHYGEWTGRFKVTNYSNKNDIAYSENLNIIINDDYQSFMNEKILKNIANNSNDKDGSIYDVLNIKDINLFSQAIKLYGLNRLISFRDAINGVLNILIEANGGDPKSELYEPFYSYYYNKLSKCNEEIKLRKQTILDLETQKESYDIQRINIQNSLNFRNYLGEKLYRDFTVYLREDKYKNDNYISDGLSNEELFKTAQDFLAKAQEELIKSSHYKHSIKADVYNLLLLEEFSPIVKYFELGNWIRVRVDDEIYRLRLVSYVIDFDNPSSIDTEFSDITKTANGMNDVYGVLKKTKPVVSTYESIQKKAINGKTAADILEKLKSEGINSSDYNINADNSEITFDKGSITGKDYDDVTGDYSSDQFKITKDNLSYTPDGWKTAYNILGRIPVTIDGRTSYNYGINANYCISSTIVAGNIYSKNYSSTDTKGTHINLDDGTFSFADGRIVFSNNILKLTNVEIDWSTTNESADMWASIQANANGITTEVTRAKDSENELSSRITQTATEIRTEIQDVENSLTSSITQTALGIRTDVKDIKEGLESSITQTASTIRAEVSSTYETKTDASNQYTSIMASLSVEKDRITAEIERAEKSEQNLNGIITSTESRLDSKIEQTAGSINLSVSSEIKETKKYADSKANEAKQGAIDSINETLKTYSTKSELKVTNDAINSAVSRIKETEQGISSANTTINQLADKIEHKVEATDFNGNTIASKINQTATTITIDASKINLNGAVTANSYFKINTDGSMECNQATIKNATITNGTITNAAIANGTITNATCTNLDVQSGKIGSFTITDTELTGGTAGGYTTLGIVGSRYAFSTGTTAGANTTRNTYINHNGYMYTSNDFDAEGYVAAKSIDVRAYHNGGSENLYALRMGMNSSGTYIDLYYNGNIRGDIKTFYDALEVLSNKDLALHAGANNNYIYLYNNSKCFGTLQITGTTTCDGSGTFGGITLSSNAITNATYIQASNITLSATSGRVAVAASKLDVLNSQGSAYVPVNASDFVKQSAKKYKTNICDLTEEHAMKLLDLNPICFDYIRGKKDRTGFFVDDVQFIYPEVCSYEINEETGEMDANGIDYSSFVPDIIKMIQIIAKRLNIKMKS